MFFPQPCELCAEAGYSGDATHMTEDGTPVCDGCWHMLCEQMPSGPENWQ